jgi:uncharacterized protein
MDEAISEIELPLFPLNTVLFPGQVLPLHIFEERYRLMIRRCLAEDLPFGVVLIRHGRETGDTAEPDVVGTSARIIESSHMPDGTLDIVSVGVERFRIRRLLHDQPYLRGEVEALPMDEPSDPRAVAQLAQRVRDLVTRYINLIAEAAGLQIQIDQMPDTPQQIGYLAAVAMQIDNKEKQDLLGSTSLAKILASEMRLLNRENALLNWMIVHKEWPESAEFGPGGMLLPN